MCEAYSQCPKCGASVFHNREQVQLEKTSLYRQYESEGKVPTEFAEKMLVCPKCGHTFPLNQM